MERKNLGLFALVFVLSVATGFFAGETIETESTPQKYDERLSFTANASNPVTEAPFDNKNISLIVQPSKNASFFLGFDGEVKEIKNLAHDGDIHELRKMKALGNKTYLLYFRYRDNASISGDEWLTLYRAREL